MSRTPAPRRRFRVVARPQERARRLRLVGAFFAVSLLGAVALAAARHAVDALKRVRLALPVAGSDAPEAAVVAGVAEPMRALAQEAADAVAGSAGEKAAALRRKFPCVADVGVRRGWGDKNATLTPVLRRAVARAAKRGRDAGYLGEDGTVFAAPQGVYELAGPVADVGDADETQRRALAREWPALSAAGAFPSPLSEMAFVGEAAGDSWEARLEDGTTVTWGKLEFTKDKLTRLAEALNDARAKTPATYAADLRWFEDGKVLLRPAGFAAGAHGGVR